MVDKSLNLISGEMVFMQSVATPLAVLKKLMFDHNLTGSSNWLVATPSQALKHVLKQSYLDRGTVLVRKTKGHHTFEVVKVAEQSDARNKYRNFGTFRVDSTGEVQQLHLSAGHPEEWSVCSVKTQAVRETMKCCLATRVSGCLFKVMMANFGSVRVSRGAYFVPAACLEAWDKFANDWIGKTENKLSRIQSGCDANTAIAVVGGAKEDLKKRYSDTKELITINDRRPKCKSQHERKKFLKRELELIEKTAIDMGKAFSVAIDLADEITSEAKLEQALAMI